MHKKNNSVIYSETGIILKNTVISIFGHTTKHIKEFTW